MWRQGNFGPVDTTLTGVTLSNGTYIGGPNWTDPPGGSDAYVGRFAGLAQSTTTNTRYKQLWLCDRLWHNGGLDPTGAAGTQTINSPTWPARDINGATAGEGVYIILSINASMGAGTPAPTISYTNTAGTSGRTGNMTTVTLTSAFVATSFMFGLDTGDTGVQSVQSFTLNGSWTSGTMNLVAIRPICALGTNQDGKTTTLDPITGGLPRMYNGSVPFILGVGAISNNSGSLISTELQYTFG
jgi:hypothetical protein